MAKSAATKKATPITNISPEERNAIADAVLAELRDRGVADDSTDLHDVVVGTSQDLVGIMRDKKMRKATVAAIQEARSIWDEASPGWVVKRAWKSGASGKGLVVLGAVGTITVLTVVAEGGCRIFGVKGPLSMLAGKLVG